MLEIKNEILDLPIEIFIFISALKSRVISKKDIIKYTKLNQQNSLVFNDNCFSSKISSVNFTIIN